MDATVLFLDICKFSARPSWTPSEQENLLRILSLFFSEMIRIVQDFGGVVEKNTGDGLMAYFTRVPNDQTTPQQRGVAAALTMFSAADLILNPIIRSSGLDQLDFRVCLDHGPITVAQVGAARGFNGIVAIGTTANIACKMLSHADPNSIAIGKRSITEARLKHCFDVSRVCNSKYANLKKAIWIGLPGLVSGIAALLVN